MKDSYSTEILLLMLTVISTVIVLSIDKWYFAMIVGTFLFFLCSKLVGILKKQTVNEVLAEIYRDFRLVRRKQK